MWYDDPKGYSNTLKKAQLNQFKKEKQYDDKYSINSFEHWGCCVLNLVAGQKD